MKTGRVILWLLLLAALTYLLAAVIEREYQQGHEQARSSAGFRQYSDIEPYYLDVDPLGRPWSWHMKWFGVLDGDQWIDYSTRASFPNDSEGHVTCIAFDNAGTAWIGTTSGLISFDGNQQVSHTSSNSGLQWDSITALTFDGEGRLWIVSRGEGLTIYDGDEWAGYPQEGILDAPWGDIVVDDDEVAWIRAEQGILTFHEGNWNQYLSAPDSVLPELSVSSLVLDPRGRVWIGTRDGIAVVEGDTWVTYTTANSSLPSDIVGDLDVDSTGNVWAALYEDGIAVFDGSSWEGYTRENSGLLPGDYVETVRVGPEGRAWLIDSVTYDGSILYSIGNISDATRTSPILVALRPFTFAPEARWVLVFIVLMLSMGFICRVEVPIVFDIVLVVISAVYLGGDLSLMTRYRHLINPIAFSLIVGSILAMLGGIYDVKRKRFGIRQRTGIVMGVLGSLVSFCPVALLIAYS